MVGAVLAVAAAGCASGSQPHIQSPAGTSGASQLTPSPAARGSTGAGGFASPSIDPQAQPAVDAYRQFSDAIRNAQRKPLDSHGVYPPEADFRKYSFDPIKHQYALYLLQLAKQQVAFRGTPPSLRVSVASVDLSATPTPLIVLSDCPTLSDWKEYLIATGKEVPDVPTKVSPPFLLTVEVSYYLGRWGVTKITSDKSRTCTV
jgi:hypothetical protein